MDRYLCLQRSFPGAGKTETPSPQQMQAMMATHQQMMSQLLDGMGADMRGMRMSGTPEWTAPEPTPVGPHLG